VDEDNNLAGRGDGGKILGLRERAKTQAKSRNVVCKNRKWIFMSCTSGSQRGPLKAALRKRRLCRGRCGGAEFFFDAEKLVVLGDAVGTGWRSRS